MGYLKTSSCNKLESKKQYCVTLTWFYCTLLQWLLKQLFLNQNYCLILSDRQTIRNKVFYFCRIIFTSSKFGVKTDLKVSYDTSLLCHSCENKLLWKTAPPSRHQKGTRKEGQPEAVLQIQSNDAHT